MEISESQTLGVVVGGSKVQIWVQTSTDKLHSLIPNPCFICLKSNSFNLDKNLEEVVVRVQFVRFTYFTYSLIERN